MPIDGKLEVILKISTFPTDVITTPTGGSEFKVLCSGKEITISLKSKLFQKLVEAQAAFPQWVAAFQGKIGPATPKGFVLSEPILQIFEKKPKPAPDKTTPNTEPKT